MADSNPHPPPPPPTPTPTFQPFINPLPFSSHLVTVKLNHENYLLWKAQIMPYLKGQNLFGFVDGTNATTSRQIWVILEDLFAAKSQAQTMHVQYQLAMLKKGFDSVATYYQKAKLLRDTLFAAGKPSSSSDFVTFLLAGLGSDYESMVTSITTPVDALSPPQVYSHLLTHEA
ncbi:uncharacterized protein LOC121235556 [Juglans microcarpa x Juglans regia]|uniref:uncharacterized protein LOC121235556 n=1 Tax=Juglans microcarpa x Juglans regia TaxID=2249226 RepID=UPI001B7F77F2|nr:uncharacterized protein LOC121235556 [Juglans microcarpa x Juglans regia]